VYVYVPNTLTLLAEIPKQQMEAYQIITKYIQIYLMLKIPVEVLKHTYQQMTKVPFSYRRVIDIVL